jgi:hypothetical protein
MHLSWLQQDPYSYTTDQYFTYRRPLYTTYNEAAETLQSGRDFLAFSFRLPYQNTLESSLKLVSPFATAG